MNNDKLLSLLAHDMKAPLANISSLFTLVELNELSSKEIGQLSEQIDFRIKNVLGFLENVLYWSKTQFSDIQLQKSELSVTWLIDDIIKVQQQEIDSKNIEIKVVREGDDTALADQDMLRVVFRNLISNAVKFSHEGGTIEVTIESDTDELRISVQDYGVGMSREVRRGLFRDVLMSERGTRNEAGTGLGLYLSNDFVKIHSGRISVVSKPDEGAKFVVHLPKVV
ncbi:MAG: HAMP domain-containing sensor histidine kinase [Bacteroidota bacterium]